MLFDWFIFGYFNVVRVHDLYEHLGGLCKRQGEIYCNVTHIWNHWNFFNMGLKV